MVEHEDNLEVAGQIRAKNIGHVSTVVSTIFRLLQCKRRRILPLQLEKDRHSIKLPFAATVSFANGAGQSPVEKVRTLHSWSLKLLQTAKEVSAESSLRCMNENRP